jgi:outer membrane protein OmpA-like peptidoglycan-associated protein
LSNGLVDLDGCPDFDNAADSPKNVVAPSPDSAATAENSTVPDYETARNRAVDSSGVYFDESQDDADPDSVVASPKKVPEFPQQQIVQGLEFKNGKTELLFSSFSSLDKLIKPLKDCPDVQIEVRAYTDALGKANANMQLTQMRAEAIRQYLINQGIDPQRISAKGCGSGNPIGDNRTAAGRTLNRRIEIVRTK